MCVGVCWFAKGSCRGRQCTHKAVQQKFLPAPGTLSKTTRRGTEREKDMKVKGWRLERARVTRHMACVRRQMSVLRRGKRTNTRPVASAIAVPLWAKETAVLARWDSQSSSNRSLMIFTLLSSLPIIINSSSRLTSKIPLAHAQALLLLFSALCSFSLI